MINNNYLMGNSDSTIPFKKKLNDKNEKIKQINIKNLKSPLLKIIFSFLNEKKKLKIIINNKKLQGKLDIKKMIMKILVKDIKLEKEMEKEKNMIILMINYYLKENI